MAVIIPQEIIAAVVECLDRQDKADKNALIACSTASQATSVPSRRILFNTLIFIPEEAPVFLELIQSPSNTIAHNVKRFIFYIPSEKQQPISIELVRTTMCMQNIMQKLHHIRLLECINMPPIYSSNIVKIFLNPKSIRDICLMNVRFNHLADLANMINHFGGFATVSISGISIVDDVFPTPLPTLSHSLDHPIIITTLPSSPIALIRWINSLDPPPIIHSIFLEEVSDERHLQGLQVMLHGIGSNIETLWVSCDVFLGDVTDPLIDLSALTNVQEISFLHCSLLPSHCTFVSQLLRSINSKQLRAATLTMAKSQQDYKPWKAWFDIIAVTLRDMRTLHCIKIGMYRFPQAVKNEVEEYLRASLPRRLEIEMIEYRFEWVA